MNKSLILNAAARCMAPDQYEKFESLISTGDLGERFSRCISKVVIADTAGAKPEPVRDVVEAWDAYTADRSNEQAAILFVLAMNKLREELAVPPAPSSDTAGAKRLETTSEHIARDIRLASQK